MTDTNGACCPVCGQLWRQTEMPREMEFVEGIVYYQGKHVAPLTRKKFILLKTLFENIGRVVSRDQIHKTMYPSRIVYPAKVLDVYIRQCRSFLADQSLPYYIQTVRCHGYMVKSWD